MLKYRSIKLSFLLLNIFLSTLSFSQKATISEVRLYPVYPDRRYFSPRKAYQTIFYPLIHVKDTNVQRRINQAIYMEIIGEGNSVLKELKNQVKEEGLVQVIYEVTMNEQWVLSLNIFTELGRDIIIRNTYYFNFDLHTGEEIKIDDLIDRSQKDSFQKKVTSDKLDSLEEFKKIEVAELKNYTNDTDTYNWAINQIESCFESAQLDQFSLSPQFIEIVERCELPKGLPRPQYHLKYPFKIYYYILNEKYKNTFKAKQ